MSSGKDIEFDDSEAERAGPFDILAGGFAARIHAKDEYKSLTLSRVESDFAAARLSPVAMRPGGRHDLLVMTRGFGLLVQGQSVQAIGSGDVVLLGTNGDTRFALARCSALLASFDDPVSPIAFRMPSSGSLLVRGPSLEARVARFLLATIDADVSSPAAITTRLLTALDVAATTLRLGRTGRTADPDPLAERLLTTVDAMTAQRPIDPAGIAAAVGISRATLYRMTARFGGVEAFMRARRLDLSVGAILDARRASDGIKSIALQHGFATAAHFSRSFRARFAMSASDARKLAANMPPSKAPRRDEVAAAMRRLRQALQVD